MLYRAPNFLCYSLACRPLISHYNAPLWRAQNALNIALPVGLYLAIILAHCRWPQTPINIALPGGLYIANIMYSCRGP
jgi:hypothetical protein